MGLRSFEYDRVYKWLFLGLIVLFFLSLILGIVFKENIERNFIYFPVQEIETDPSHFGLLFEDVYFAAEDGIKLHGWFVPGERGVTWLWFHGNGGNISHRLDNLVLLHEKLGVSIFLFDYRGYGNSQGKPTEKGLYLDSEAALGYLYARKDVNKQSIVYFGRSLGTAIAVEMAARHPPSGLILEAAFPSIDYMARHLYPYLPVWPFLSTRYDAISRIKQVETPLLMLHGDKDDIIPIEAGQKLFGAATGDKRFFVILGANHNDTYIVGGEAYIRELDLFIQKLEKGIQSNQSKLGYGVMISE